MPYNLYLNCYLLHSDDVKALFRVIANVFVLIYEAQIRDTTTIRHGHKDMENP